MSDLIDRQAAIDALLRLTNCKTVRELFEYNAAHNLAEMWPGGINDAIDAIIAVPPAQPERIKGRWIYHPEIGWGETWLCDQCGEKTASTVMGKPRANFCPNCGAEMEVTT